jgi:hypothetical protein
MTKAATILFGLCLWAILATPVWGRHDPLNDSEIDQLRDVAQQPDKRLPLFVSFIQQRMDRLQQLHSDPRFSSDRNSRLHDLIEDLDTLVQQLDDNIGVYAGQNIDIRKQLHAVIEMDSTLQERLRAIKQRCKPEELKVFGFSLDSAIDSVDASLDNARQIEQEQQEAVKSKKK